MAVKIVFVDQDYRLNVFEGEDIVSPMKKFGEVVCYDDSPCSGDELYERARDAEIVFFKLIQPGNGFIDRLSVESALEYLRRA